MPSVGESGDDAAYGVGQHLGFYKVPFLCLGLGVTDVV